LSATAPRTSHRSIRVGSGGWYRVPPASPFAAGVQVHLEEAALLHTLFQSCPWFPVGMLWCRITPVHGRASCRRLPDGHAPSLARQVPARPPRTGNAAHRSQNPPCFILRQISATLHGSCRRCGSSTSGVRLADRSGSRRIRNTWWYRGKSMIAECAIRMSVSSGPRDRSSMIPLARYISKSRW